MSGRVVVAGGSGYIGRALVRSLAADGDVVVLTRDPQRAAKPLPRGARAVRWDGRTVEDAWARELRGARGVVNLAGASVGSPPRWTSGRKRAILESRLASTGALVEALRRLEPGERPPVLVNTSGIDYAGTTGDAIVTEEAGPGDSFLARVCVRWEAAARRAEELGVRIVLMRTPFVVSREAPALRLLVLPFRLYAGGPLGGGEQWFPWAHLEDTVGLFRLALTGELSGPLNVVAPDVRKQRDLALEIGRVLRRPARLPVPRFALRILLGEAADIVLHGQRATSRAEAAGYRFRYPDLPGALEEALGSTGS